MPEKAPSKWQKSSPELVELFTGLVSAYQDVEHRKMFGYACCFANGYLFAGLFQNSILFRLADVDLAGFLKQKGAIEFEPMAGRKMKNYGVFPDPLERSRKELEQWTELAHTNAMLLPPKEKAKSKPKAKRAAKR